MKKVFRLAIEQLASEIVAPNLRRSGIKSTEFTAHKDGSCTVGVNDDLRDCIVNTPGVEIIKSGVGTLTFRSNAMADFAQRNPPLYTEAEKAQIEAEKLARKANRVKRNSRLELLDDAEGDDSDYEDYEEVDADSDEE